MSGISIYVLLFEILRSHSVVHDIKSSMSWIKYADIQI